MSIIGGITIVSQWKYLELFWRRERITVTDHMLGL